MVDFEKMLGFGGQAQRLAEHQELEHLSSGTKLSNSCCGMVFGFLFFFGGLGIAGWNEYRNVANIKTIRAARDEYKEGTCSPIMSELEGELVHVTCPISNLQVLGQDDPVMQGIPQDQRIGLSLASYMEVYQWQERSSTTTKNDNVGGGTTKVTTYTYDRVWSFVTPAAVNQFFNQGASCQTANAGNTCLNWNPTLSEPWWSSSGYSLGTKTLDTSKDVQAGDYIIPPMVLSRLGDPEVLTPACNSSMDTSTPAPIPSTSTMTTEPPSATDTVNATNNVNATVNGYDTPNGASTNSTSVTGTATGVDESDPLPSTTSNETEAPVGDAIPPVEVDGNETTATEMSANGSSNIFDQGPGDTDEVDTDEGDQTEEPPQPPTANPMQEDQPTASPTINETSIVETPIEEDQPTASPTMNENTTVSGPMNENQPTDEAGAGSVTRPTTTRTLQSSSSSSSSSNRLSCAPGNASLKGTKLYWQQKDSNNVTVDYLTRSYTVMKADTVSILAEQRGNSFVLWESHYDDDYGIFLFADGNQTATEMIDDQERSNVGLTWFLRFFTLVLTILGLVMITAPLTEIPDIVPVIGPWIGDLIGYILWAVNCCLGCCCWAFVVSLSWIAYRPIVGIPLLVASCALCAAGGYAANVNHNNKKKQQSSAADFGGNKGDEEEDVETVEKFDSGVPGNTGDEEEEIEIDFVEEYNPEPQN